MGQSELHVQKLEPTANLEEVAHPQKTTFTFDTNCKFGVPPNHPQFQ